MKRFIRDNLIGWLVTGAMTTLLMTGEHGRVAKAGDSETPIAGASQSRKLLYVPPRAKGPPSSSRIVAVAVRGGAEDFPTFAVLSPDHVGLTVQEQPALFWYLSKPIRKTLVMTMMKGNDIEPMLEIPVDGTKEGIQRLDLAEHHVKLLEDAQYQITLALIPDPEHRDKDIIASGMIKRVTPPDQLLANLQRRSKPMERAILLAHSGVWYDALAVLSDQIEADRSDKESRLGRAELLDQVNLPDAALYDRSQAQGK